MNRLTTITLAVLLLAPLAALNLARALPEVPRFGILRTGLFQALEKHGTQTSSAWN
jgi:hypothetical protein